jgi:hypothetical protein
MSSRQEKRLLEKAAPLLRPDERVDLIALAKVGTIAGAIKKSFGRNVAVGVLTAGTVVPYAVQKELYILLTSHYLHFFSSSLAFAGDHAFSVARPMVAVTEPTGKLIVKFQLHIHGEDPLALSFPRPTNKQGRALADALPRAETT